MKRMTFVTDLVSMVFLFSKQNIQEELDRVQQEVNQINRRLGRYINFL